MTAPTRAADRLWWPVLALIVAGGAALRLVGIDRWPTGLHYDEAAYGLQGLELLVHPRLQVFFPAFTGREPLFIYWLALVEGALGPTVPAIRIASAAIGVAAIVTTAFAGRALFGSFVGLLGAALLAGSFWHITLSRMTYRAGLVAALGPLAIWLLWRLWQRPAPIRAVLAGAAIGLLAYTYVAVRLLPVALLLFAVVELVAGPLRDRRRLAGLVAAALVAGAVAAPLAVYFVRHPDDFGVRFAQTVTLGKGDEAPGAPLVEGALATLRMYGVRGDELQKYNLPLRPALDPVLSALLVVGVVSGLARGCSAGRLAFFWLLGGLAPGFLTADSPNFLRLLGAAPPSYLFAALGFATLRPALYVIPRVLPTVIPSRRRGISPAATEEIPRRSAPRDDSPKHRHAHGPAGLGAAVASLAALICLAEAGITTRDYFWRWAPSADTYYALHGDMADLGRAAAFLPNEPTAYVASEHYRHPTVAFTAGSAFDRLRWFDGRDALVLPPPGQSARYLIPRSARPPELAALGPADVAAREPDGAPSVEQFDALAPAAQPPALYQVARRGGSPLAELEVVEPPSSARAGETAQIKTVWRLLADAPTGSLDLFVHAVDAGGRRWGQRDASPYLTDQWRRGETLIAWLDVPLEATAPPGPYQLRVGLDDPDAPGSLELRRPDGAPMGSDPLIGALQVAHAAARSAAPRASPSTVDLPGAPGSKPGARPTDSAIVRNLTLGPVLLEEVAAPSRVAVGETAWIDLLWRAGADSPTGPADLLLRPADGPAAPASHAIGSRDLSQLDPATPWREGETIRDARRFRPGRADAGRWRLVVRVGDREQELGPIEVTLPSADFELPHPQVARTDDFGGVARLLGVDVRPGGVRLYWQGREPSDAPLSVFVHALGANGQILAQHDGQPVAGRRPTTGWIPDEVIADDHPLALPPDWAALAIGLYDQSTGQRLPLPSGADHVEIRRP